jgi:hypothetical protein
MGDLWFALTVVFYALACCCIPICMVLWASHSF